MQGVKVIKKSINNYADIFLYDGTCNAMAKSISMIPVAYTACVLNGMKSGIIISIPFVNVKCAIAVNTNITDIAMRPAWEVFHLPRIILMMRRDSKYVMISTKNGFITYEEWL